MQVDRISIAVSPDLGKAVREAASQAGVSVSAWFSGAAADRLRNQMLGTALDVWEEEVGTFSEEELNVAGGVLEVDSPHHNVTS